MIEQSLGADVSSDTDFKAPNDLGIAHLFNEHWQDTYYPLKEYVICFKDS